MRGRTRRLFGGRADIFPIKTTTSAMKAANVIIHRPLAITFLLITAAVLADAETILIDWGDGSGTGGVSAPSFPAGDGKYWNSLGNNTANPTNAALIDSTNGSTPVTVTVSTGSGSVSGWGDFNGAAAPDPYDEFSVRDDALFNGDTGAIPITFSGLLANTEYDFTMISRRPASGRDGKVTITTGTSTDIGSGLVLVLNGDVLSFSATSDATGKISLGFAENTAGGGGAVMNGMTITGDFTASTPAAPQLSGFTYDPVTGNSEVSLKAAANTDYKLVEASDLDFATPDQDPVTLLGASIGTVNENTITTDGSGNATVQFNLGTANSATFIRAETP
ncbi:hypothetical protein [Haloferula sp. A504]|uniref:hypothetical protein n=1 Tax=Haloferula sp. A504 TaxID=3373601 RepID=UPI0031BC57AE|nr:hypothetical protein [Verrucomicrobiaceae bacterium E54]